MRRPRLHPYRTLENPTEDYIVYHVFLLVPKVQTAPWAVISQAKGQSFAFVRFLGEDELLWLVHFLFVAGKKEEGFL